MAVRLERGLPGKKVHGFNSRWELFFIKKSCRCEKNHVGLWEKSCQFVGKFMLVCGKNHVGLWEKSRRFVGKFRWSENFTEKYPHMPRNKIPEYLRLFAEVPRLTTSI